MGRRSGARIRTTEYKRFKGVDFSTDASLVESYRSPWSVNMTADTGGMPEKRLGWRTLCMVEGPINGLFYTVIGGETKFLIHGGTKLYAWDGRPGMTETLLEGLHDGPSQGISFGGKLWVLTGGEYLVYDGAQAYLAAERAYIPTTAIGMNPAKGGGKPYEALNLLTGKRKNEFIPDGAKVYQLDAKELDDTPVTAMVWGEAKEETADFTVDRKKGTVTFKTAPAPPAAGLDGGVVITFSADGTERRRKAEDCRIITTYGVGTSDRVVISGNPKYPNLDWMSDLNRPDYFPENAFAVVGTEATPILGYLRLGEYLAIVKGDNGQDSTIFLRSAALTADGTAVFPVKQSVAGVGAVSMAGFGSILDEQLFLSGSGVYAITTNALTAQRIVQNRSAFVNNRLSREPGLDRAAVVSYQGMLLVGVNGHVYLLDGRQDKTYLAKSQGEYVYECYYWENVPAACWLNFKDGVEEHLLFGTADGRVCRFNDDMDTMARYSDDGAAIFSCWATPADDDGDVAVLKTLIKRGNSVTIKPYTRSSAKICFRTDRDPVDWQAAYETMDIFDWEDMDFSRISFDANDGPREIMFNTKVKKYKRLQIIVKNDRPGEGFGIFGIVKHFVTGNFAKR